MKKIWILGAGAYLASGCTVISHLSSEGPQVIGSGKVKTVSRTVGSFHAVSLEGSMDADITIGSKLDVKVTGDDNLVDLVKTEIKDGTLSIGFEGGYSTKNPLKVTIVAPSIDAAGIEGSGDMSLHKLKGKAIAVSIAGSGDLSAEGSADKLTASISGSGDMKLGNLKAVDAQVSINGSGGIDVFASGTLNASIAGSGDIRYKGHPKVTKSIAGSGDVSGD